MKRMFGWFIVSCILIPSAASSLELTSGVKQEVGMRFNDKQREALTAITSKVRTVASREETGISLAFVELADTSIWYRLYENLAIYEVNVNKPKLLGAWSLSRWSHEYLEPEYMSRLQTQYDDQKDRRLMVNPKAIGCLSASPLRYGSIDSTGNSYLVLFMANDFLVFSPEKGRVIFSATLSLSDWMTRSATQTFYEDEQGVLRKSEEDPQYASSIESVSARWGALPPREPGYRGYGKLYFGDFSENEKPDILLWRKLYISRLVGDETEGFEHIGDTLIHYQLIDGEYQPRDTDATTIQSWLSENDLTWQLGYPSKSECEGEEGELIPEMHDPLLNDPDVLK